MDNHYISEIKELYMKESKHSNYQILPKSLQKLISPNDIQINSRYEEERLNFIKNHLDLKGKKILDIGGNCGFFSFELLEMGASNIDYVEGNQHHALFVKKAAELLDINDKINVRNEYYDFHNETSHYDLVLLLNVLHHLGDDYGDQTLSIQNAKMNMIEQLNSLADKSKYMVFQLGFNWKGNKTTCLFEHGTKKEMIDFITNGIQNFWHIEKIGIAEKRQSSIQYFDMNFKNIERNESLGEFLNRPIFILKSLL